MDRFSSGSWTVYEQSAHSDGRPSYDRFKAVRISARMSEDAKELAAAKDALRKLKASGEHVTESGVRIDKGQFGKKVGKHAEDYGLDPSSERARALMMRDIRSIVDAPDEVVDNVRWGRGDDKARHSAFCQGDDAVLVRNGDAFVTILRGGAYENARIENSRNSQR